MNQAEKIAVYTKNARQLKIQEEVIARLTLAWDYEPESVFPIPKPDGFSDARWVNFVRVIRRQYEQKKGEENENL